MPIFGSGFIKMKVLYKNKKVEKLCTNEKCAIKELGKTVADKLLAAIIFLEVSENLKEVLEFPIYHLHALKGDLEGLFSMYLGKKTGYRLILTPLDENEDIINREDMSFYTVAVCVEIEEVSKHYE